MARESMTTAISGAIGAFTSGFRSRMYQLTFQGKRNVARALGYKDVLELSDFRQRFNRNEVANRVVKAFPYATWRGGFEIYDDEDPQAVTPFEQAWVDLDNRLKIVDKLRRADVLAGLGHYAIVVIGGPGETHTPLVQCVADDLIYMQPYAEDCAKILTYQADRQNPRYGFPDTYQVSMVNVGASSSSGSSETRIVHWSRVLHVSDGLLENNLYGEPRLQCIWNRLDDLEKVAGGGAEAFWMRANPGTQFDLDPELDFSPEQKEALKAEIIQYEHGQKRTLFTRGVDMKVQSASVSDIGGPVNALMSLIAAGSRIPQRVLMGSEQGKLAAKQDASNWNNQVTDRQNDYANPLVARVLVDRFIELGILPSPIGGKYTAFFNTIATQDPEQRLDTARKMADLNKSGKIVVVVDEIRAVLGLAPLSVVDPEAEAANNAPPPEPGGFGGGGNVMRKVRKPRDAKGGAPVNVHAVADRFRGARKALVLQRLRRGSSSDRRWSVRASLGTPQHPACDDGGRSSGSSV